MDLEEKISNFFSDSNERELGLVLSGIIFGYSLNEAISGQNFRNITLLALGIWLVFNLKPIFSGDGIKNSLIGKPMFFSSLGVIMALTTLFIIEGREISIPNILWFSLAMIPLCVSMDRTFRVKYGLFILNIISSFAISSWLLIEIIFDVRIALQFSWLIVMLALTSVYVLKNQKSDRVGNKMPIGIGMVLAGVFTVYYDNWNLPWPYTADGSILMFTIAIGIGFIAQSRMIEDSWSEEVPNWIKAPIVFSLLLPFWPGIWEEIVVRHHEFYTYGLFNSLAQNGLEDFWGLCDSTPNRTLSQGAPYGEPGGCWLYPTGGLNLPVILLMLSQSLGFSSPSSFRVLGLLMTSLSLFWMYKICEQHLGTRSAWISVLFFVTAPITLFWGQMLTFHHFGWLWMSVAIYYWLPILYPKGVEDISSETWIKLQAIAFSGILIEFQVSIAVCISLSLFLILQNKIELNKRLLNSALLMLWPLVGYYFWSIWIGHWFPEFGSEYLQQKANSRSQFSDYLMNVEYYVRQSDWHTRLSGPVLLGLSVVGLRKSILDENCKEYRPLAIAFFVPLSLMQWIIFPKHVDS